MTEDWMRPMSASLRRRIRKRRIRMLLPVVSPWMDRLREKALDGHVCQRFTAAPLPGPHICPSCRTERADYEGAGWHLSQCPHCGTADAPVPG